MPGTMETLTAQARAERMLDRLGLERILAARVARADKEAKHYRKRALKILDEGLVKYGPDGERIEADRDAAAVKWAALAESAYGRADKSARHLYAIVTDRERRADLERRERDNGLIASTPKTKAQPRGVA